MEEVLIDLHTHTNCSDGVNSPIELYKIIKEIAGDRKVIWSVTDHDCVDAYEQLKEIKDDKVKIIKGCEFGFAHKEKLKDMLAYDIDIEKARKFLKDYYTEEFVITRQRKLLEGFKDMCRKHNLKFEDGLEVHTGKIGEAYKTMMRSLKKFEENFTICPDLMGVGFFRKHFINPKSPFFVKEKYDLPDMKGIIDLIHSFGGKAFLAHSFDYGGESVEEVLQILKDAKDANVDGIEVMHYSINEERTKILRDFIKKNNLLESGGTDFHGEAVKKGVSIFTGKENNVKVELKQLKWIKNI